ncbi:MAG: hypothetical protein HY071_02660 [Chloroflexi bacterium]|nr:hypothetical protein [Chloroflexota bacterium]
MIPPANGRANETTARSAYHAIWHTDFGLDETAASFLHSRLGWRIFGICAPILAGTVDLYVRIHTS